MKLDFKEVATAWYNKFQHTPQQKNQRIQDLIFVQNVPQKKKYLKVKNGH